MTFKHYGKVVWTGKVSCFRCGTTQSDIPMASARPFLKGLGWRQFRYRWYCDSCKEHAQ